MATTSESAAGLRSLGLRLSTDALQALLLDAAHNTLSPEALCNSLVAAERAERERRNLAARTKTATLGSFTTLDKFDWNHPKKVDRALYDQLLSLEFVRAGHNVIFRGPSGVGKTTLAQNLGLVALQRGFSVRCCSLAAALADLLRQESAPALDRRLKRYTAPSLLILDELGYLPSDSRSADLLYNIISRRHEQRSTIITTNLRFKDWGTVFPGAACVVALVDRFAQHCHVLDIDADSWRQKSSLRRGTRAA